MERNLSFDTEGLEKIAVHLGWAQLEMFADEVDKVQVMAAGDDSSVEDLRIAVKDGCLTVEQPQYGLSLNIMECRWLQVCVRVPSQWKGDIALSTLSGLLSARKLCAKSLSLETVSGDLHAVRICAADASFILPSSRLFDDAIIGNSLPRCKNLLPKCHESRAGFCYAHIK